ncbi:MAG: 16S rRNA (guanine(527)-N(7))-methyltransferase RsmG [Bdellovibrionales bacterium]|nr:16S rRNA (guanine(527)-N(7))-methyltransferase RsmG [Bdellovibrionales bacterium]
MNNKKANGGGRFPSKKHRQPEVIYTLQEANDRLYDIFRHHGFEDFPHSQRLELAQFYRLLMTHQLTDNVTRLTKFRDIAIKHFIDSLLVPKLLQLSFPLLDMGTGAGFPGIPLKVVFPEKKMILAEGVKRRVDFLKEVRIQMQFKELDIIGRNIDPSFDYPVEGVITRAVELVSRSLKNVSQCLKPGGKLFLMKGPNVDPEIAEAKKNWGETFALVEDIAYCIPQTPHQRRLLVYQKIRESSKNETLSISKQF